jgi:hypothetical protein
MKKRWFLLVLFLILMSCYQRCECVSCKSCDWKCEDVEETRRYCAQRFPPDAGILPAEKNDKQP